MLIQQGPCQSRLERPEIFRVNDKSMPYRRLQIRLPPHLRGNETAQRTTMLPQGITRGHETAQNSRNSLCDSPLRRRCLCETDDVSRQRFRVICYPSVRRRRAACFGQGVNHVPESFCQPPTALSLLICGVPLAACQPVCGEQQEGTGGQAASGTHRLTSDRTLRGLDQHRAVGDPPGVAGETSDKFSKGGAHVEPKSSVGAS